MLDKGYVTLPAIVVTRLGAVESSLHHPISTSTRLGP